MDFESWFRAEVIADRLYGADEDAARFTWDAAMTIAASVCERHAENAGDDEAYSVGSGCAAEIRAMKTAPQPAGD